MLKLTYLYFLYLNLLLIKYFISLIYYIKHIYKIIIRIYILYGYIITLLIFLSIIFIFIKKYFLS